MGGKRTPLPLCPQRIKARSVGRQGLNCRWGDVNIGEFGIRRWAWPWGVKIMGKNMIIQLVGLSLDGRVGCSTTPSCLLYQFSDRCIHIIEYQYIPKQSPEYIPAPITPQTTQKYHYFLCLGFAGLSQQAYINKRNKKSIEMALRRNQLKKMTLDEIMVHLSSETDPDSIKLINNFVSEKNAALMEKRNALAGEVAEVRGKLEKSVRNLNGRVRDRIEKKETVIMDKDSRPTATSVTDLMTLFAYLQDQGRIISRNNNSIKQLAEATQQMQESLRRKAERRLEYADLDQQFEKLNAECRKQEAVRDSLLKERDEKRHHYANIESSIESYRKQYDKVETAIRIKEREFIQLSGYYEARTNEDRAILIDLPVRSMEYEQELLAAQEELNACRALLDDRRMMQIEGAGTTDY